MQSATFRLNDRAVTLNEIFGTNFIERNEIHLGMEWKIDSGNSRLYQCHQTNISDESCKQYINGHAKERNWQDSLNLTGNGDIFPTSTKLPMIVTTTKKTLMISDAFRTNDGFVDLGQNSESLNPNQVSLCKFVSSSFIVISSQILRIRNFPPVVSWQGV